MNTKILGAFLFAALMSGCVVVADRDGGGGGAPPPPVSQPQPLPGDVTFTWSFSGYSCADYPEIRSVRIKIPGEALQNEGVYPCSANNYPGIVLHDFAPGSYSFELEAIDYSNVVLFAGGGTFAINGDARVTIDLTPVGGPNSWAYLTWRFPANSASQSPDCASAGVSYVDVSINGAAFERFNCADGFALPGITTPYLEAGTHSITLVAVNASNYPYYRYTGQLQTFAGNPISAEYHLDWAVGGAAVQWQLTNGSIAQTCAQAGVDYVYIDFQDASGNMVYGNGGDKQPCNLAPVLYQYLLPGTYWVYVQGVGSNGTYLSNAQSPPQVTVAAGAFVSDTDAVSVQMFRQ